MILKRVRHVFQTGGVGAVLSGVLRRLARPRASSFGMARELVRGRTGLEIGGPSPLFSRGGMLPVYPHAARIDNCNFADSTIWEGDVAQGAATFKAGRAPGRQYIAEGSDLRMIGDGTYDFVLSSHMLEHSANPLRTLGEWLRLLRAGGALVLVLPHRDGTFDHRRDVTSLEHLEADLARGTTEDDQTHVDEILRLHDLARDPGVAGADEFQERARRNVGLRSLHHHVFDSRLAVAAVERAGFVAVAVEPLRPYHIVVLARKPDGSVMGRAALDAALRASPFPTDRKDAAR